MNRGLIPSIRSMRRLKAYWMELTIKMIDSMIKLRRQNQHPSLNKKFLVLYQSGLILLNKEDICPHMSVWKKIITKLQ
jgi:hypothetical protein